VKPARRPIEAFWKESRILKRPRSGRAQKCPLKMWLSGQKEGRSKLIKPCSPAIELKVGKRVFATTKHYLEMTIVGDEMLERLMTRNPAPEKPSKGV